MNNLLLKALKIVCGEVFPSSKKVDLDLFKNLQEIKVEREVLQIRKEKGFNLTVKKFNY